MSYYVESFTTPIQFTGFAWLVCAVQTGSLVKTMVGEDFSSTDLHLANGDTLLVGQVAELAQISPDDVNVASRLHVRKLQVINRRHHHHHHYHHRQVYSS